MMLNRGKTTFLGTVQAAGKDGEQGKTNEPMSSSQDAFSLGSGFICSPMALVKVALFWGQILESKDMSKDMGRWVHSQAVRAGQLR